jgi:hypothetical protein
VGKVLVGCGGCLGKGWDVDRWIGHFSGEWRLEIVGGYGSQESSSQQQVPFGSHGRRRF